MIVLYAGALQVIYAPSMTLGVLFFGYLFSGPENQALLHQDHAVALHVVGRQLIHLQRVGLGVGAPGSGPLC